MARRSDHTRDQLIGLTVESAWNIVNREGFDAATARRVAADIGYAPGTIYNLLPSMDALYLRVSARTLDMLHEAITASGCAEAGGSPPADSMKLMARCYRDFAKSYKNNWLMLFIHTLPEGEAAPAWFDEKITLLFEPLESLLAPYFMPLDHIRRKHAARTLWGAVHGLCFLDETGKIPREKAENTTNADILIDTLIDNFVAGLERKQP